MPHCWKAPSIHTTPVIARSWLRQFSFELLNIFLMYKWISSIFIKATGRNWMKRLRQGRGRSLLRKRSWLITRLDGVSGIQGGRENLLTTPHSDRGQKNKEAWQKNLTVIWIDLWRKDQFCWPQKIKKRKYTYSISTFKAWPESKHKKKVSLKIKGKMDPSFKCTPTPIPDFYKIWLWQRTVFAWTVISND